MVSWLKPIIDTSLLSSGMGLQPLIRELAKFPDEEIDSFDANLGEQLLVLETDEYFYASDARSDDPYLHLCLYAIAQGRAFYECLKKDPSKMLNGNRLETLLNVAHEARLLKCNKE